jgi:hypothetical protein
VKEQSETVNGGADAYTEFHIEKRSGWPKGKHTVHLLANGNEVKSADIMVK